MACATNSTVEPKICEVGGGGLLLPLGGDSEQEWPNGLRVVLYLLGLGWLFMGVAIVADVFMAAIEKITSKKTRKLVDPAKNKYVTVSVWNSTVANLTLMALGSSAPEILLNVIDIFASNFFTGALGPFTIVGSAAFNLFCITAVCVAAIPNGERRIIKELEVYLITAVFSVFAYLWLIVILMGTSENLVDVWEGVLTFLFFPILVQLAFMADKGYFRADGSSRSDTQKIVTADMSKDELAELEAKVRKAHGGATLTDEQVLRIIEIEFSPPASRAAQRVAATRAMTGGKRVKIADQSKANTSSAKVVPQHEGEKVPTVPTISFEGASYAVLEGQGTVDIPVIRTGDLSQRVVVAYSTRDGQAEAGKDYHHSEGHLTFEPGSEKQNVTIKIIDDTAFEDDEEFYIDLKKEDTSSRWELGNIQTSTITIIDDDLPGELGFKSDELTVYEGEAGDTDVEIVVHRNKGTSGKVGCKYYTENDAAVAGVDYEETSGNLEFEGGSMTQTITVTLKNVGRYDREETFRLIIAEPTGGAKVNPDHDGGDKGMNILTVKICPNAATKYKVDRMKSSLEAKWEKAKVGHANWREQFVTALKINGGEDEDDEEEAGKASIQDYVMHVITVPWKLLFACCPPVDYCGGWLCFCVSLGMIGLVTAVIGDMAGLLGCTLGIADKITAITFVALGTSLPDTFASKTAASQDAYADAAICNVTGSNSVNVFLGLGLPWMLGSIYWVAFGADDEYKSKYYCKSWSPSGGLSSYTGSDAKLVVEAGDLGKSVAIFCGGAVICLTTLYVRRVFVGGELGGPAGLKYATSGMFVSLWLLYVLLSALE